MTIPLMPPTATSRRILQSAYNYCRTTSTVTSPIIASRSLQNKYDDSHCHGNSSLRYYYMTSSSETVLSPSSLLSACHNIRHCKESFGHDRRHSHRNYSSSSSANKTNSTLFDDPSKLPPSSSSILKQEDHELSAEELQLKIALNEYIREKQTPTISDDITDNDDDDDDDGDYLLENLQRAYMDLEYWEEALQIEVHKCHLYFRVDTDEYADSVHAQGKFHLRQEDFANSKRLYEEALEYFERTENSVQQGHVLISLAGWYFFRNQLDAALDCLHRSEAMLDSNPALLYKCLDNQGLIYRLWGEFHVALDKYQQALQVVVADDKETRSALKMHMADMFVALEEPNEALTVYQDLLIELTSTSTSTTTTKKSQSQHQSEQQQQQELGMRGVLLHNIATIHVDQGQHELAVEEFQEALTAKQSAGGEHNPEVAKTLNSLGALHAGVFGEKQVALEYFQQALFIARIHAEDGENPRNDPDVKNALQNISVMEQDLAGERQS